MSRLPTVSGDTNSWGAVLNDFLGVGLNAGGTLKSVRSVYNVKDDQFGAKGDWNGATGTDDTTAIQAASTAAAVTGGVVYLPPGSYKITAGLTIGSNVTLAGAGMGLSILVPRYAVAGTPNYVIANDWVNGNTNIGLVDFSIQRSAAGNVQHAILLNGVTIFQMSGVRIFGTPQANSGCLALSGASLGAVTFMLCSKARINDCQFDDTSNFGIQLGFADDVKIRGNGFNNCYREAIGIEPETACTVTNVAVSGNVVEGSATAAGTPTGLIILTTSSGGTYANIAVSGNTIDGGATPIGSDTSPGIFVTGGTGSVTISGNTVRRTNGPGIALGAAGTTTNGLTVTGNNVYSGNAGGNATPNAAGIRVRQVTGSTFTGNTINGASFNADIEETSSSSGNTYTGNDCQDTVRYLGLTATSKLHEHRQFTLTFPGAGGAVSVDLGLGNHGALTVTDGTAFTINSPSNHTQGRDFTYEILNSSGGVMGAVSFGAQYKLAGAFTVPLSTKKRTITFRDNGTNCIEIARSAADI